MSCILWLPSEEYSTESGKTRMFTVERRDRRCLSQVIKVSISDESGHEHVLSQWWHIKVALYLWGPPPNDTYLQSKQEKNIRKTKTEGRSAKYLTTQNFRSLKTGEVVEIAASQGSLRRRWWHPTPVLLPGKSHGRRSLVSYSPWGR